MEEPEIRAGKQQHGAKIIDKHGENHKRPAQLPPAHVRHRREHGNQDHHADICRKQVQKQGIGGVSPAGQHLGQPGASFHGNTNAVNDCGGAEGCADSAHICQRIPDLPGQRDEGFCRPDWAAGSGLRGILQDSLCAFRFHTIGKGEGGRKFNGIKVSKLINGFPFLGGGQTVQKTEGLRTERGPILAIDAGKNGQGKTKGFYLTVERGAHSIPEHHGAVEEPDDKQNHRAGKKNRFPLFFLEDDQNQVHGGNQQNPVVAKHGCHDAQKRETEKMVPFFQPCSLRFVDFNNLCKDGKGDDGQRAVLHRSNHNPCGVGVEHQKQPGGDQKPCGAAPPAKNPV